LRSPPAAQPFARLVRTTAALAALALVSVAAGAFLLPRLGGRPARKAVPAAVAEKTEAGLAAVPASDRKPEPAGATRNVAANPDSVASEFDHPMVAPQLPADDPAMSLSRTIDEEIDHALKTEGIPASPLSGDAEFLRRVHLDLTGRIPSRDRTIAFLDSQDPQKRAKLVRELMGKPEYGKHFARIWADLLVKRDFDSNRGLQTDPFIEWMATQFNKNFRWNEIVTDLVTAEGSEERAPQTFFLLANLDSQQPSPSKLVGATSNLFMGIQLHCAECHTHPFNDKWQMDDFWGMAAFFAHTRAERQLVGKRPGGPATFSEVESRPEPRRPRVKLLLGPGIKPGLVVGIPDPTDPRRTLRMARGKFFESDRPLPTGPAPYRPHLATWLTSSENRYFAPAAVNRLWAHFFARGLVNPLDDMNDKNKPSHPALLETLAYKFTRSGYDQQFLIRAICNSRSYQRTSRPLPENARDEKLLSHMPVKVMSAQVLLDSLAIAAGRPDGLTPLNEQQALKVARKMMMAGKRFRGPGGDPRVRFFDTREYDGDPTEFSYGIPQILRLMNGPLTNSGWAVAARFAQQGLAREQVVEEMYLIALSRRPRPAEVTRMVEFIDRQENQRPGYVSVYWALLNSAEFVSNH
jgi:hypothetical protein